jgi:cytochrome c oxidase subunit 2
MSRTVKVILTTTILILALSILTIGSILISNWFFLPDGASRVPHRERLYFNGFSSNGERIFLTGTSDTGSPISSRMEGMQRMPPGRMSCASCHGADAHGGTVQMMMTGVEAPDIRWEHLTNEDHAEEHGEQHPTYTRETFERAVTEGLDPEGEELHWMMPRWDMTQAQLDDLIAFLQTLD